MLLISSVGSLHTGGLWGFLWNLPVLWNSQSRMRPILWGISSASKKLLQISLEEKLPWIYSSSRNCSCKCFPCNLLFKDSRILVCNSYHWLPGNRNLFNKLVGRTTEADTLRTKLLQEVVLYNCCDPTATRFRSWDREGALAQRTVQPLDEFHTRGRTWIAQFIFIYTSKTNMFSPSFKINLSKNKYISPQLLHQNKL